MTKAEARKAFPELFDRWAKTQADEQMEHPSFLDFKTWLSDNHFSHYMNFRSVAGPHFDVDMWFDRHFKQAWRN